MPRENRATAVHVAMSVVRRRIHQRLVFDKYLFTERQFLADFFSKIAASF